MNILNKVFDKVVFINLNKRADRLEKMQNRLNSLNIKAERIEAIQGNPWCFHKRLRLGVSRSPSFND